MNEPMSDPLDTMDETSQDSNDTDPRNEQMEEWARTLLCTEPSDKAAAETGIEMLYEGLGLEEPMIVWCGSPHVMTRVHALLVQHDTMNPETLRYEINKLAERYFAIPYNLGERGDAELKLSRFEDAVFDHFGSTGSALLDDQLFGNAWNIVSRVNGFRTPVSDWEKIPSKRRAELMQEARSTIREKILDGGFLSLEHVIWRFDGWLGISETKELIGMYLIACSTGWMIPNERVCIICERPSLIKFDESRLLHSESGPAIEYSDACKLYYWHGVSVPEKIIVEPGCISVEEIEEERNVEVRRVMIERYGRSRYLSDCGATEIQRDEFGVLYRKEKSDEEFDDDREELGQSIHIPMLFVKVVNATLEKDGTKKEYFLRVLPQSRARAKQLPGPSDFLLMNTNLRKNPKD